MLRQRSLPCRLAQRAVLLALLLLGTPLHAQLPDLERGKLALANGDFGAAQRDLLPLAAEGYLEAQLRLASGYAKLETPEGDREAARWYRAALPKAPELKVRLARTLLRLAAPATPVAEDTPPPPLDAAQLKLIDDAEQLLRQADAAGDAEALLPLLALLTAHPSRDQKPRQTAASLVARAETSKTPEAEATVVRWYRLNQRPEQPEIAAKLISRCKTARAHLPECVIDLGRHYRTVADDAALQELVGYALGRLQKRELEPTLIERLGNAMLSDSVAGASQTKAAHALLSKVADQSTEARVRLARLLIEEPALDPDAKPAPLLESAVAEGSPEAALSLARLYLRGIDVVVEPKTAERLLLKAVDAEPSAHYFLGRLYHRGEVGEAAPVKAADHYLQAARRGYARADLALAQLYSENRGVRVNRPNAYLFARLAANGAVVEAQPLLEVLRPQLTAADLAEAEARLTAELMLRARLAPAAVGTATSASNPPAAVPRPVNTRLAQQLTYRFASTPRSAPLLSNAAPRSPTPDAVLP